MAKKKHYKLICMSFDGDYVTEGRFDMVGEAWARSNDMGSRWYFYPFHFVSTEKTIKEAPTPLEIFQGMRIKTVSKIFNSYSKRDEAQGMDCDEFVNLLDRGF